MNHALEVSVKVRGHGGASESQAIAHAKTVSQFEVGNGCGDWQPFEVWEIRCLEPVDMLCEG